MSTRTIVYKGMLLADQVGTFYLDLQDPMLVSALAMVHQRFSTNTFPTWDLAHPFRVVCQPTAKSTPARQLQLDSRPRRRHRLHRARRRPAEAVAADLRRPVRHRVVRQLPELLTMGGYSLAHAPRC